MYGTATALPATGAAGLTLLGYNFGMMQVLLVGLAVVAASIGGYRVATSGKRYGS